ncbi:DUF2997 domain-containing protein [Paenibacillus albicereus]|uniref:DUF2997 domain-containing protein n=1 Tax=Paenibacillus albicereus TaxID=2726185 RepID=A0A6H2GSY8_9BACL|nr:DUF2997 domain-containing protein [Paenibacillus albicereus]QJC50286.1 DUF2997 domain-containing protein [Paenibacillus albicereus]
MAQRQIKVRIYEDGRIQADVIGIKGKGCIDYISILEQLLEAETTDSSYTSEYYESEQSVSETTQVHHRFRSL